jgi:hypothetical protein
MDMEDEWLPLFAFMVESDDSVRQLWVLGPHGFSRPDIDIGSYAISR